MKTWLDKIASREEVPGTELPSELLRHLSEQVYDQLFKIFPQGLPRTTEDHLESQATKILARMGDQQKLRDMAKRNVNSRPSHHPVARDSTACFDQDQ